MPFDRARPHTGGQVRQASSPRPVPVPVAASDTPTKPGTAACYPQAPELEDWGTGASHSVGQPTGMSEP